MKNFKKFLPFAVFLLGLASLSSCNRGIGCPNNFSLQETAIDVIKTMPTVLIKE